MAVTLDDVRSALEAEEPDYDALAARFGAEAIGPLVQLAAAPDPEIGPKAIYLASLIAVPQAVKILLDATHNPDPKWRVAAAGAAENLNTTEATPILRRLIRDTDPRVKRQAIISMPADAGRALERALTQILTSSVESYLRDEAKTALDRIKANRQ
jgi:HEAT repeat protein